MQANRATSALEVEFRHRLWRTGLRYRLRSRLPGRPDLVFPGRRVVVFVHGCYWHACPTCRLPAPKANAEFWSHKFEENARRDAEVTRLLTLDGWDVRIVWEHDLRRDMNVVVARLGADLGGPKRE